jgi:hypothetical protein
MTGKIIIFSLIMDYYVIKIVTKIEKGTSGTNEVEFEEFINIKSVASKKI